MTTEKLIARLKNKTWTNPYIKELKTDKHSDGLHHTQQTRKNIFNIPNTINTIHGENCESSWVQVSL
jgi:hypothetical protein